MPFVEEGTTTFLKRISRYNRFTTDTLLLPKKYKTASSEILRKMEGDLLLDKIASGDYLVLLDEKGKEFTSRSFASWIQKQLNQSHKRIVFVIGGAFGFDKQVYDRADFKLSLSQMTYSHQLIRVIFTEQLYRAFSILNNEKYHND